MRLAKLNRALFKGTLTLIAVGIPVLILLKLWCISWFQVNAAQLLRGDESDDVMARRDFLIEQVTAGAAHPERVPEFVSGRHRGEWAMTTLTMSVSAATNIAFLHATSRHSALAFVEKCVHLALSNDFRSSDTAQWKEDALASLDKSSGHAAYLGNLQWMFSAYRALGGTYHWGGLDLKVHETLKRRMAAAPCGVIESYPRETYVPDNLVIVAALPREMRVNWVKQAREKLIERESGLMVSSVDEKCAMKSPPRGSAVGRNSFFLPFIDERLAGEQFEAIRQRLVHRMPLGIAAVREWPEGIEGSSDIGASGPLISGFGPFATAFTVAGARHWGDGDLMQKLLLTTEVMGFSFQWAGRRRYLALPLLGDAVLLAMKTSTPWRKRTPLPRTVTGSSDP